MPNLTNVLADAIVAAINAERWDLEPDVSRVKLPRWKLPELDRLKVSIVPREASDIRDAARGLWSETLKCQVGIQQKVKDIENETLDSLDDFADALDVFLRRGFTVAGETFQWQETDYLVSALPDHLAKRAYTTVFDVTYRGVRRKP